MELLKLDEVNDRIVTIRQQNVILNSDVAALYGVETMRINEAVKNNPDKFPAGYIFELTPKEKQEVIEIFDNPAHKYSPALPVAFTRKGCYMLATILKSARATQTTLAIIEAFDKMQSMSSAIVELMRDHGNEQKQAAVLEKGEELFGGIVEAAMERVGTETSFELNLAALKIKHTVKRAKKMDN